MKKPSKKKPTVSGVEVLSREVFLPAMTTAVGEAAKQAKEGTEVLNAFVNSFALVLTDMLKSGEGAADLLEGLAKHIRANLTNEADTAH
jgi:hypothetical protein